MTRRAGSCLNNPEPRPKDFCVASDYASGDSSCTVVRATVLHATFAGNPRDKDARDDAARGWRPGRDVGGGVRGRDPAARFWSSRGAGAGMALTKLDYYTRRKRNDDPDRITTCDDPLMRARIAGTTSISDLGAALGRRRVGEGQSAAVRKGKQSVNEPLRPVAGSVGSRQGAAQPPITVGAFAREVRGGPRQESRRRR